MHKALHPRDDVDRQYESRKEGGRGLARTEDSVETSLQQLEDYTEKRGERMITASRNNADNTKTKRMTMTKKQKWEENNFIGVLND